MHNCAMAPEWAMAMGPVGVIAFRVRLACWGIDITAPSSAHHPNSNTYERLESAQVLVLVTIMILTAGLGFARPQ